MTYNMLDVSSNNHPYQSRIDYGKVHKAGFRYVMIKATEGNDYTNPYLRADATGFNNEHLAIGYYHFAQPGLGDGAAQGLTFWNVVKDMPRSIGCALDIEVSNGLSWENLRAFVSDFWGQIPREVEMRSNYCSPEWAVELGLLKPHTSWWAASPGKRPRAACWAWQAAQEAVAGIEGLTDVGYFYG